MSHTIDLSQHSIMKNMREVQEICSPLVQYFNINYFSHLRIFTDGSRICLTTNGSWVEYVCQEKLYLIAPELNTRQQSEPVLWVSLEENLVYESAYRLFNIEHGMTLIQKSSDYTDYYHFGAPPSLGLNYEHYLQLQDALTAFIHYYREKSEGLIKRTEELYLPDVSPILAQSMASLADPSLEKKKKQFLDSLSINRFYLGEGFDDHYLTARELECARWLVMGKLAEEIALILGITKRTAITHINNMKEKLSCVKTSQLIFKLSHSAVKELLEI